MKQRRRWRHEQKRETQSQRSFLPVYLILKMNNLTRISSPIYMAKWFKITTKKANFIHVEECFSSHFKFNLIKKTYSTQGILIRYYISIKICNVFFFIYLSSRMKEQSTSSPLPVRKYSLQQFNHFISINFDGIEGNITHTSLPRALCTKNIAVCFRFVCLPVYNRVSNISNLKKKWIAPN